jgi:hypothetical protein
MLFIDIQRQPKSRVIFRRRNWNRKRVTTKNSNEINGRGDRIRTCDIYVPNVALYQSELHPGKRVSTGRQS